MMLTLVENACSRSIVDAQGDQVCMLSSFCEVAGVAVNSFFVVASGPSVTTFDFNKYNSYPFMAMNGSILACDEFGISPYFYLCDDAGFAVNRSEIALLGVEKSRHLALSFDVIEELYKVKPGCLKGKSVFLLQKANRFVNTPRKSYRAYAWSIRHDPELLVSFSLFSQYRNRIGFSLAMDKGYFVARTIPYVALQLARTIGVKKVFLVGVDMTPAQGRFYEKGMRAVKSRLDKDYEKIILPSFRFMARNVVKKEIFEVFNLSASSRIPEQVIPKVATRELDTLLS